jgi:hypothetical protein
MKVLTWRVRRVVRPIVRTVGKTLIPYTMYTVATEHHPPDVAKFVTDTTCVETISFVIKTTAMYILR